MTEAAPSMITVKTPSQINGSEHVPWSCVAILGKGRSGADFEIISQDKVASLKAGFALKGFRFYCRRTHL